MSEVDPHDKVMSFFMDKLYKPLRIKTLAKYEHDAKIILHVPPSTYSDFHVANRIGISVIEHIRYMFPKFEIYAYNHRADCEIFYAGNYAQSITAKFED